jgi:protein-disulfide isomerase
MSQEQPVSNEAELSGRERRRLRREAMRSGESVPGSSTGFKTAGIWIAVVVVLLLIVGGIVALVVGGNKPPADIGLAVPVNASDWTTGASLATSTATTTISLVEYSDFQCPACAYYYPWVKQLLADVPELAFTYRNFPLTQIHKNAELSAWSAEAAGRQGHYWEMNNLLFEHQQDWAEKTAPEAQALFEQYAVSAGVNLIEFKKDLTSDLIKNKVSSDFQTGVRSGVNATPSFFLNGKFITNPRSYNEFLQLVKGTSTAPRI